MPNAVCRKECNFIDDIRKLMRNLINLKHFGVDSKLLFVAGN